MQNRHLSYTSIYPILSVFILVIIGSIFRLWGINFGLPYLYHPDEPIIVIAAQNILRSGSLNPHWFLDPPFFIYLNALIYIPYLLYTRNVGGITMFSEIISPNMLVMGTGFVYQPKTILIGRLLTCSFGVASIIVLFFLARRFVRSNVGGILAALFLSISPGNIYYSKLITPDTHFVFFALLTAWFSYNIFENGRIRDYLLAGLMIGLAAGVKYNAVLIAVLPVTAHIIKFGFKNIRQFPRLFVAGLFSIVVFVLTNPYIVIDFNSIYQGIRFEAQHYSSGHAGMEGNTLVYYIRNLWQEGGLAIVLGIISIIRVLIKRKMAGILLGFFPVFFFFFINMYTVRNEHTALPITPFLLLFASVFIVDMWELKIDHRKKSIIKAFLLLALVLSVWMSISRLITRCTRLTIVDSRETARIWIDENIPEKSSIALEAYSPYVDPKKYTVFPMDQLIIHNTIWYEQQNVDYVIASAGMFKRFYNEPERYASQINQYEQLFNSFESVKVFQDGDYEVRIYRLQYTSNHP